MNKGEVIEQEDPITFFEYQQNVRTKIFCIQTLVQ